MFGEHGLGHLQDARPVAASVGTDRSLASTAASRRHTVTIQFSPPGMDRYDGREALLGYYRTNGAGLQVHFEQFTRPMTPRSSVW